MVFLILKISYSVFYNFSNKNLIFLQTKSGEIVSSTLLLPYPEIPFMTSSAIGNHLWETIHTQVRFYNVTLFALVVLCKIKGNKPCCRASKTTPSNYIWKESYVSSSKSVAFLAFSYGLALSRFGHCWCFWHNRRLNI